MRCLHRRVPGAMPDHYPQWRGTGSAFQAFGSGAEPGSGALCFTASAAYATHHGEGRRYLRSLRVMRRAVSHGSVGHAEVRAGDRVRRQYIMHEQLRPGVNDFAIKLANVNGTGSASANGLIMQAIFRMGIPVSGKNLFPSNIRGLPTWY